MIRDRGSNFTTAFDAVLADAGIRTVLCNVRTPRMNAMAYYFSRHSYSAICSNSTRFGLSGGQDGASSIAAVGGLGYGCLPSAGLRCHVPGLKPTLSCRCHRAG